MVRCHIFFSCCVRTSCGGTHLLTNIRSGSDIEKRSSRESKPPRWSVYSRNHWNSFVREAINQSSGTNLWPGTFVVKHDISQKSKQRAQWAREHYEQHHDTTVTTTTHTPPPTKTSPQLQIPVSPQTSDLQSPIILDHHNDSINNNINWSPTILSHYRHTQTQHVNANDTLQPPIHIMDMFEYLDHINSDHENIRKFNDSSF